MRAIVEVVTALVILVGRGSASYAASDTVKCDNVKTLAAATMFKSIMVCNHKGFADNSFDLGVCRTNAYLKCVAKFDKADLLFGGACTFAANGPASCQSTLDAANTIFDAI
jgi:hypothetical protein